jgi:hypothetical protein
MQGRSTALRRAVRSYRGSIADAKPAFANKDIRNIHSQFAAAQDIENRSVLAGEILRKITACRDKFLTRPHDRAFDRRTFAEQQGTRHQSTWTRLRTASRNSRVASSIWV